MGLREAEGLLHVMARECAEIPLPPTRRACCVCLVLPTRNMKQISLSRFAKNPRRSIAFKLDIDSQDPPRYSDHERAKRAGSLRANLSQSEYDWAFAKRARSWRNPRRSHPPDCPVPSDLQKRPTLLRTAYCYEGGGALWTKLLHREQKGWAPRLKGRGSLRALKLSVSSLSYEPLSNQHRYA
jgi:hypothetical protein